MATRKRRVIYLSDTEWDVARRGARTNEESISAYVGALIRTNGSVVEKVALRVADEMPGVPVRIGPLFAEFRPAPKPGHK
jgi:DNA-directed RNA polymerase subunit F